MRPYKRREMSAAERSDAARSAFEHKKLVLKRYRRLGLEWGLLIGAMLGILGGGLQMKGWDNPLRGWAITTLAFSGLLGGLGYLFYDIVFGSQIRAALEASGLDGDFGGGGADGGGGEGDGGGA
jgi:hypothetical protein